MIGFIASPIAKALNLLKLQKPFPEIWQIALVAFIYKQKGNKAETQNYRPICLTNIGYKIWSGAITRRLMTIINLITDPNQFGYKQNCSCIDALQQVNRFMKKTKKGMFFLWT